MSTKVKIHRGYFKVKDKNDMDLSGSVFPLVKGYTVGVHGGYVLVDARNVPGLPQRNVKVYCNGPDDFEELDGAGPAVQQLKEEMKLEKCYNLINLS